MRRLVKYCVGLVLVGLVAGGGFVYAQSTPVETVRKLLSQFEENLRRSYEGVKVEYGDITANPADGTVTVSEIRISSLNNAGRPTLHVIESATIKRGPGAVYSLVLNNHVATNGNDPFLKIDRISVAEFDLQDFLSKMGTRGSEEERWGAFVAIMKFAEFRAEGVNIVKDTASSYSASLIVLKGVKDGVIDHFVLEDWSMTDELADIYEVFNGEYLSVRHLDMKRFIEEDRQSEQAELFGIKEIDLRNWSFWAKGIQSPFNITEFSAKNLERNNGVITKARFLLKNFHIPLKAFQDVDPLVGIFMAKFKRDFLVFEADIGFDVDVAAGTMTTLPSVISADGLGRISIESRMTDVDMDAYREAAESLTAANFLIAGKFEHSTIRYDDEMLADIIFDMLGAGNRPAIAQGASQKTLEIFKANPETGAAAAQAIYDFVLGANFYGVTIQSDQPVDGAEIMRRWRNGTIGQILKIEFSGG